MQASQPAMANSARSDNYFLGVLIASVALVLTGPGIFAGFALALLTTFAIFSNVRLRATRVLPIAGILATATTGMFVIFWFV